MMLGTNTCSPWRRARLETRIREKSLVPYVPSRIGAVKGPQRRRHTVRKERISLPECLDNVSHTAEQNRDQKSLIPCWVLEFSCSPADSRPSLSEDGKRGGGD